MWFFYKCHKSCIDVMSKQVQISHAVMYSDSKMWKVLYACWFISCISSGLYRYNFWYGFRMNLHVDTLNIFSIIDFRTQSLYHRHTYASFFQKWYNYRICPNRSTCPHRSTRPFLRSESMRKQIHKSFWYM